MRLIIRPSCPIDQRSSTDGNIKQSFRSHLNIFGDVFLNDMGLMRAFLFTQLCDQKQGGFSHHHGYQAMVEGGF